jgi:hypothetical protein
MRASVGLAVAAHEAGCDHRGSPVVLAPVVEVDVAAFGGGESEGRVESARHRSECLDDFLAERDAAVLLVLRLARDPPVLRPPTVHGDARLVASQVEVSNFEDPPLLRS